MTLIIVVKTINNPAIFVCYANSAVLFLSSFLELAVEPVTVFFLKALYFQISIIADIHGSISIFYSSVNCPKMELQRYLLTPKHNLNHQFCLCH